MFLIAWLMTILAASVASQDQGDQVRVQKPDIKKAPDDSITQEPGLVTFVNASDVGGLYHWTYLLSKKGQFARVSADVHDNDQLHLFCYGAVEPSVSLFWASAAMKLDLASSNYEVYLGPNVSSVVGLAKMSESEWFYSRMPWRSKEFKISPFESACVGVQTKDGYTLSLQWRHVNYGMVCFTLAGLLMFFMAPRLCRNTFFHYTTGISVGLLMSVVILTYLLQRKVKQSVFSWVGLVYSLSVYLMTRTWFNIKEYLTEQYFHLVVGYVVLAGFLSFAAIYRMGPPSDHRTLNLITWSMQFVSLVMIYLSSYNQHASLALIILIVSWAAIPARLKAGVNTEIRKRFFKPKIKLLSEEDYNTQAHVETRRALEELKSFCRSPESKPWQTVSKLNDPRRFAEFIEGSPHLTEGEVMEYSHWEYNTDDDHSSDLYTDDEEAEAASDINQDDIL